MQKLVIVLLLVMQTLSALTLDEIVAIALEKNPTLHSIEARLEASKIETSYADAFENPTLLFTTNTLPDNQAMSQSIVTVSQKIPYASKRQFRQDIAKAQSSELNTTLQKRQVDLVYAIKSTAYKVWRLKEERRIINAYITLTNRLITLYASYASVKSTQHMGLMKAELSLSKLKIKNEILQAQILKRMATLQALSAVNVPSLELTLSMPELPRKQVLFTALAQNLSLEKSRRAIATQRAKLIAAKRDNYPDFNLLASYAYRKNFENYFAIGVGITLPIYGTEDANEQAQEAKLLAQESQLQDVKLSVNANFNALYAQLNASFTIYHIITDDALPQVEHMESLANSAVSTQGDLFKSIDVLFEKLALQLQRIDAIANFHQQLATIEQLQGKLP